MVAPISFLRRHSRTVRTAPTSPKAEETRSAFERRRMGRCLGNASGGDREGHQSENEGSCETIQEGTDIQCGLTLIMVGLLPNPHSCYFHICQAVDIKAKHTFEFDKLERHIQTHPHQSQTVRGCSSEC